MPDNQVRFTPDELQYIAQNKQPDEILQVMGTLHPDDRKVLGKIMGEGLLSADMPSGKFLRGSMGMAGASVAAPVAAALGGPVAVSAASNPYVQGGVGMAAVNALPLPSSIKYAIEAALGLRTMIKGGQGNPSPETRLGKSSQTLPMSDSQYQAQTGHPRLGTTMPSKAPSSPSGPSFPSGMGQGMARPSAPPQSFPAGTGKGMPKVPPFGQGMPQAPQPDLDSRISGLPPGPSNGLKAAPPSDFYERLLSSLGGNQGRPTTNSTPVARRTLRDAYASQNKGIGVEDQNRIMSGKGPAVDTRQGMSIEQLLAELKKVMPR